MKVSKTHISRSSDFALSLEDYLMYEQPYFGIMSPSDLTCDVKINVGHCHLYFMVQ